jgi:hypothetical protein
MEKYMYYTVNEVKTMLSNDKQYEWLAIGKLLSSIAFHKLAKPNLTTFVREFGIKYKIGEAQVWRYKSSYMFYYTIRDKLNYPVSPEIVELLEKLSRVLNDSKMNELYAQCNSHKMSRNKLRDYWNLCRQSLDTTKRGHGDTVFNVDNSKLSNNVKVWNFLENMDSILSVIGGKCIKYILNFENTDIVLIINNNGTLQIHAFDFNDKKPNIEKYVDGYWIVDDLNLIDKKCNAPIQDYEFLKKIMLHL